MLNNHQIASVQVQIVTYNSSVHIIHCLESVYKQAYPIERVLVIDNCSSDDCLSQVKAAEINVDVIQLERNCGYAAAHNLGFIEAIANDMDFVLTLNPDVVLQENYVSELVSVLLTEKSFGGATGKLLRLSSDYYGKEQIIDSSGLQMGYFYHVRDRGANQIDLGQYGLLERVWGVCGAAATYKVAMLRDVQIEGQVLDETFFVYKEDVDLCWRANRLGWGFIYIPVAQAVHKRGWNNKSKLPRHAIVHSFVNQIGLLVEHAPNIDGYFWITICVEIFRYLGIAVRKPVVAFEILKLLKQNWSWICQKRIVLSRREFARRAG